MAEVPDVGLDEADVAPGWLEQFRHWYSAAGASGEPEPEAMSVATVTPEGLPSVRVVLLKAVDERGFVFYTNYRSRKGADFDAHPVAALVWRWARTDRQVRAVGSVHPVSPEEADAYFAGRQRRSQLGAWASPQSQILGSRAELVTRLADAEARFAGGDVPRPPWWGGLRVAPVSVEFWQGRADRLHDRLRYRPGDGGWVVERLAP